MTKKTLAAVGAGLALAAVLSVPTMAQAAPAPVTPAAVSAATNDATDPRAQLEAFLAQTNLDPALQEKLRAAVAKLPADWQQRQAALAERFGLDHSAYREITQSVINPDDHQCAPTPMRDWASKSYAAAWKPLFLLTLFGAADIPTYDALIFGHEAKTNTFGVDGGITQEMNRTMTSLRRFWDIPKDVELMPMHGRVLSDPARVVRAYEVVYGMSREDAELYAGTVAEILAKYPEANGGDHPYLTFNAFAYDPQDDPWATELGITKRIVMGDGIVQAQEGIGLPAAEASRGILAHEYGHQVQYAKGLFASPLTGPEATRRTELMADAMSTYALVHSRGAALNAKRTLDVQKSFFNVGDCGFSSPGHHGTPNQRIRSTEWAAQVVDSAPNQGHKLTGHDFAAKFDAQLPVIVAPDAR
ncbi:hypothetical protein ACFWR9_29015 [Streptomyces sp. NPDC058534]|uniref:hypothetical protein n=1 Tax=Streptomyces sp. NPDC058534 TaxID=3346541 RepID=UPI00365C59F2